ncbi:hypothetical protein [Pararcticibacter amylolyticus]|uniref:hypothetical protein n=1 Tax=Pararcticibacter amylolyticus TaxID=2173175 RepID=UPI001EE3AB65|nr:hypothetical protein [Pararcticibacter amylolyticus]
MNHGSTYFEANKKALGALEATIARQSFLMSYMNAFFLIALLNTICIPLVIMTIKRSKGIAKPSANITISDH